ncbi:hypothetical protein pEaSNUABM37_00260 [Erwinia phage pEa_SNUABM_37]|nr:hypothetical protein pEaSNUABM37_00260 [Erwinia phage pEa_SNUABM_37]QXO10728.1 hypothetical protein pEaSNUABM48_00260 [Erwinia phage pEa_SNUABM_48]
MFIPGGYDAVDAVMGGGRPQQSTLAYFDNQYQNMLSAAQNVGNTALQQLYQIAQQTYNYVMDTRPWEMAEALIRQTTHMFDPNAIRPLMSLAELQTAKPTMQRWIMAMPEVREMFQNNQIDGYSASYEDAQPGTIGVSHYDWRRATNSMVAFVPETDDWSSTTFVEELAEGDRELSFGEKADITITWGQCLHQMHTQQYDPTSVWNNKL